MKKLAELFCNHLILPIKLLVLVAIFWGDYVLGNIATAALTNANSYENIAGLATLVLLIWANGSFFWNVVLMTLFCNEEDLKSPEELE